MALSGRSSIFASARRLKKLTLVAPLTVQASRRSIPFGDYAARLHRQRRMTMRAEFLLSRVVGGSELSVDIADVGLIAGGDIGAVLLE